jgi:hypothetical protein
MQRSHVKINDIPGTSGGPADNDFWHGADTVHDLTATAGSPAVGARYTTTAGHHGPVWIRSERVANVPLTVAFREVARVRRRAARGVRSAAAARLAATRGTGTGDGTHRPCESCTVRRPRPLRREPDDSGPGGSST